ncbi:hypothetical protein RJ639_000012 [Escallonia herrerae]|uniref:NAC domain-containing protein n=1 Tax=Escallonia herrerae TaxID=1293975 RepID=A0AA89BJ70_9ASTE|nr:hypothetical protein RJ639_000012 [Escallonia herrerae]
MGRLPAGFRFDPTDDEVLIYLSCKVSGSSLPCDGCVMEGDIYDENELHQIFNQIKTRGGGPEYFFTQLKKKGKKGCKRFDRTVGNNGNWHATQTKKILDESGKNVAGFLKSFVFKGDEEDHWNMDEFSLSNKNDYVLCRIKNNKKRKFGHCYGDNGEAAVHVPDLEPVTKPAKHDQFLTASTSYYLNNSREKGVPLISPASCCILPPPIYSGPSLTNCGTDMGKADDAVWDEIQNPLAMEGGVFNLLRSDVLAAEQNLYTNSDMPFAAAEEVALPDVNAYNAAAMADLMADLDGFDAAAFADLSFLDALIGAPDIADNNYIGELFYSNNFQCLYTKLPVELAEFQSILEHGGCVNGGGSDGGMWQPSGRGDSYSVVEMKIVLTVAYMEVVEKYGYEDVAAYALNVAESIEVEKLVIYKEGIESTESVQWTITMSEEMESLYKNQMWELLEREFKMKNLATTKRILGMEIQRDWPVGILSLS